MTTPKAEIIAEAQAVWGLELQPAGCPACKTAYLVEAARLGKLCPNCGRDKLKAQPARMRPEAPELLIPFRKSLSDLLPTLQDFVKPIWLHSDDLTAETLARRAVPIYWPEWLVDADVAGNWKAEMGFDYQVKSSQENFVGNNWQTRDVLETRIRWEPRLGEIQRHYDNIAVHAIENHNSLTALIGDCRASEARPYEPSQVKQAMLRIPDRDPEDIWHVATDQLDHAAAAECSQAAQAQHVRQVVIHAEYANAHWTQLLHPLYATVYTTDDGAPQILYINGQTGQVGGTLLASQKKGWLWAGISLVAALLAFILGLVCAAIGTVVPPLICLSGLLLVFAVGALIFGICAAAWPWQWNRQQMSKA
jgi:hypothetical protein